MGVLHVFPDIQCFADVLMMFVYVLYFTAKFGDHWDMCVGCFAFVLNFMLIGMLLDFREMVVCASVVGVW